MSIIFKRRSTREYLDKPVQGEDIKEIIRAGMAAPSAMDRRSWQFLVATDKENKKKIVEAHPYAQMIMAAGAIILIFADTDKEFDESTAVINCAAAIENMLLRAVELELGSCWVGLYNKKELTKVVRATFNVPDDYVPVGIVVVGYPREEKPEEDRYDENLIHYETF